MDDPPDPLMNSNTPAGPLRPPRRILDPIDRISEILFGLIMVLTFTGSLSVAEAGRKEIQTMLIGALGCNLAWGIIDAVFYLMGCLAAREADLRTIHAVRAAEEPRQAHHVISEALPPVIASIVRPGELEMLRQRMAELPAPPERAPLQKEDWLGALAVFLLVFLSMFPVVIPFFLMQDAVLALRASNVIAVVMLFMTGYAFGSSAGRPPWLMGISMLVLGVGLVAMTIVLGG